MIAKLLISPSIEQRKEEINLHLNSHLGGGLDRTPREKLMLHPDVLYFEAGSKLGIEQARQIKDHLSLKPYQAEGRVVVLEDASALTPEAQNALLKTLEEPPGGSLLLLGTKSESDLLPTILSRCQIVHLKTKDPTSHRTPTSEVGYVKDIEKLLDSTLEERFEYIEKLKTREEFLHALVHYFHQQLLVPHQRSNLKGPTLQNFLKDLLQVERWAAQNVNIRAILEYLMLVMPKI